MAYDPGRPLVFMHVAKSSGTSLSTGLLGTLLPCRALTGFDGVMFGGFRAFDSFCEAVRRTIWMDPSLLPRGADFVHGHFSFSTTREAYPQGQFISILREPRVRLLSLWRYWRRQTASTMSGWGDWIAIVARSHGNLDDFLDDPVVACQTDNMALRMLLWPHPRIPENGFIDPRDDRILLDEARMRLNGFDHLDIVENSKLADNLRDWLGRPFDYRRLNDGRAEGVAGERPLHRDLSWRSLDLLEARTRLDQVLWEVVIRQRMPDQDIGRLRERTILRAVARYARVNRTAA